jgi:hypothetical protein
VDPSDLRRLQQQDIDNLGMRRLEARRMFRAQQAAAVSVDALQAKVRALERSLEEERRARAHAEAAIRGHQHFDTTQVLEVCSPRGIWRRCAIVEVERAPHESVLVHYHGFNDDYDEWIPAAAWPARLRWAPTAVQDSASHALIEGQLLGAERRASGTFRRGDGVGAQPVRIETQSEMIARLRSTASVSSMRAEAEKRWTLRFAVEQQHRGTS